MSDELNWATLPDDLKRSLLIHIRSLGAAVMVLSERSHLTPEWWAETIAQTAVNEVEALTPQQVDRLIQEFQKGQKDRPILAAATGWRTGHE